jgi:hypothetical protein
MVNASIDILRLQKKQVDLIGYMWYSAICHNHAGPERRRLSFTVV